MSVLFEVYYTPVNPQVPDSRLEVGKIYGVEDVIDSPDYWGIQYRLQEVSGTFAAKNFTLKRQNFFARSPADFIPEEGNCIKLYRISVLNNDGTWTSDKSNLKIEKVVTCGRDFYDIQTSFGIYHTYFPNL